MFVLMDSLFLVCDCELDLIFLRNFGEYNFYKCKYKIFNVIYNDILNKVLMIEFFFESYLIFVVFFRSFYLNFVFWNGYIYGVFRGYGFGISVFLGIFC